MLIGQILFCSLGSFRNGRMKIIVVELTRRVWWLTSTRIHKLNDSILFNNKFTWKLFT